jgi:hypothetical protein
VKTVFTEAEPELLEPAPVTAIPAPAKNVGGRPPKHGVAMTAAQRKAASRAGQKQKQDDAECRKLIADLMKVYRRQQAHIVLDPKHPRLRAWEAARTTARQQERQYLNQLHAMSQSELESLAQTQGDTPDSLGRLHGERSGEGQQINGQSEIERLFAAKQHDSSNFEDEDQDPKLAAGFKVKPEGCAPDSSDPSDTTVDKADQPVRRGAAKPQYEPTAVEKWLDKTIDVIVSNMDFESGRAECPFCQEKFMVKQGAINHLHEQYGQGGRDLEKHRDHMFGIAAMNAQLPEHRWIAVAVEPMTFAYFHYKLVCEEMEKVRKAARKKPVRKRKPEVS